MFTIKTAHNDEPKKTVQLQFRAMHKPMEVTVPLYILRYLDAYAIQNQDENGAVIYQCNESMPLMRVIPLRKKETMLA